MDARLWHGSLWLAWLALAGCAAQVPPITPSADRDADNQPDPPQVAIQPSPETAAPAEHSQIVAYAERAIERLDDLRLHAADDAQTTPSVEYSTDVQAPEQARLRDDSPDAPPPSDEPILDARLPAGAGDAVDASPVATRAPTIVNVSVRANLAPQLTPPAAEASNAEGATQSDAIAALLARVSAGSSDGRADDSFRAQFDRRMIRLLAGDYEGARAPFEAVPAEQAQAAADFIEAIIAMREAHGGDSAAESSRVLAHLDRLRAGLIPLSELTLPQVAICREVVGFGLYEPIEPPHFPAGVPSEFVAYCEILHLSNQKLGSGEYETLFDVKVSLLTTDGRAVQEIDVPGVRTRWRDPRHECFIAPLVRLPASLSPGAYVAKITVADRIGQKVAQQRATFRVQSGN